MRNIVIFKFWFLCFKIWKNVMKMLIIEEVIFMIVKNCIKLYSGIFGWVGFWKFLE